MTSTPGKPVAGSVQAVLLHTCCVSNPHPVPRATSDRSSSTVQSRAPLSIWQSCFASFRVTSGRHDSELAHTLGNLATATDRWLNRQLSSVQVDPERVARSSSSRSGLGSNAVDVVVLVLLSVVEVPVNVVVVVPVDAVTVDVVTVVWLGLVVGLGVGSCVGGVVGLLVGLGVGDGVGDEVGVGVGPTDGA